MHSLLYINECNDSAVPWARGNIHQYQQGTTYYRENQTIDRVLQVIDDFQPEMRGPALKSRCIVLKSSPHAKRSHAPGPAAALDPLEWRPSPPPAETPLDIIAEVLVALRQVIRATDLHSRYLMKTTGLTAPQLLVLREIQGAGELSVSELARRISLSQGTVTSILDRLQTRQLVTRERSQIDKRRVLLRLTTSGDQALSRAPQPLQEHFVRKFESLSSWEQHMILASLQRVARLMDADHIDAAPVLAIGALDQREPPDPAA